MEPKVVLIVDEEEGTRAQIRRCLAERQLECREAATAREALQTALASPPDVMLVDLYLPDQSGLGLCRTVRESPQLAHTPIIVLTSRASEMDRVLAFESGVDDFVAKPFYPPELGARVSAVLRGFAGRSSPGTAPRAPAGAIRVEPSGDRVFVEGRRIDLTPRELALLRALMDQAGRGVRRGQLIDQPWDGQASTSAPSTPISRPSAASWAARGATSRPCAGSATASPRRRWRRGRGSRSEAERHRSRAGPLRPARGSTRSWALPYRR